MASIEKCRGLVDELAAKLNATDPDTRRKHIPDRTVELTLLDLDTTFCGRLHQGALIDIEETTGDQKANIRLVMTSDDLVEMTDGNLKFAHAWATGRVRLDASIRDLLRLRSLL
ncbi:MAG: hypothetical protein WBB44_08490 [Candidatus Nanopelagicales bacterium]